jgi:hypothetical protein
MANFVWKPLRPKPIVEEGRCMNLKKSRIYFKEKAK